MTHEEGRFGAVEPPGKTVLHYSSQQSRMRRAAPLLLLAILAAYVGAYVVARATGRLVHYENVMLVGRSGPWWPGHEIGPGTQRTPGVVLAALRPLSFVEELVRGTVDRLAG